MASAAVTVPAIQTGNPRDPYAATRGEQERAQRMAVAWAAYHGTFHGGDLQWPLMWKVGKEANPNIIINRCGPAVDTDVSWLYGESVGIKLVKAPQAAQQYIDLAWGVTEDASSDDDKMALLQELATNGAITGHAYLKMVWEDGMDYPQLAVLDSTQVRVRTDPHNCKIPICYIIEYPMPDPNAQDGADGMFRQVIERVDRDGKSSITGQADEDTYWTITDYFKPAHSDLYGMTRKTDWRYAWAPVDGCPHMAQPNRYYGRPRLTPDVIGVNEAICATASNINKIGIRHGHPVLYTKAMGNKQGYLEIQVGKVLIVSDDIKAVEAHGDLANLMQFEQDLRADFDEETHVPAQAFGRQKDIPRTPVSGVAIRLGYGPLLADIMKERRTYGALIRRVTQHMLELKDAAWAAYGVELVWQDPLPADDLQQAQVVTTLLGAGIMSKRTAQQRSGLDPETEADNMTTEDAADVKAQAQGLQPTPPPDPNAPQAPQAQPGAVGANGNTPPVNHPAAIAARQTMAAAMAGGQ